MFYDLVQNLTLDRFAFNRKEGACMTGGQLSIAKPSLNNWGELEKPKEVGNSRPVLADLGRDDFLGQIALINQSLIA